MARKTCLALEKIALRGAVSRGQAAISQRLFASWINDDLSNNDYGVAWIFPIASMHT